MRAEPSRLKAPFLKDTAITFLIALILFVPIVGLKTDNASGPLTIAPHLGRALLLALGVTAVRLAAHIFLWGEHTPGAPRLNLPALRGAAAIAGVIAGGPLLAVPGLRAAVIDAASRVSWLLGTAADLLALALMAAFAILLTMGLLHLGRTAIHRVRPGASAATGGDFPIALLVLAVLFPLLVIGPQQRSAIDTATLVLIYVMLGWGLNVVVGLAGLLDLGYVAFYAVGAYSYALLSTQLGWPFWLCLPLAGLFAALWGITLGFPVLRLRGDYLAIVTLAFGEIIRVVITNWQSLTNGPNGIDRIPKLDFFGLPFSRSASGSFHSFFGIEYNPIHGIIFLYYVILALALMTNAITLRLRRLPIGRAWEALREDEIACRSLGINTVTTKLSAFAIGAMFGGLAGSFFATRQGFISPESFTFQESALVLAIVVLGGLGSQLGVVVAAIVLVGGQERFRELQDYRMLIFGLAMVAIMLWRPRGLLTRRAPTARLNAPRQPSLALAAEGRA